MLKYHTIDISCRAIPGEVCLVFNITGCTIKCPGCNEKTLWKDKGIDLNFKELRDILNNYSPAISCVCFMGGEHEPQEINNLARFVKHNYAGLRTAWYSGLNKIPCEIIYSNFNYLKTGAYEASKGALGEPGTNQRVFMVMEDCSLIDITDKYIRTETDEIRQIPVEAPEIVEETTEEITEEPTATPNEEAEENIEETVAETPETPIEEEIEEKDEDKPIIPNEGLFMEI